jgi:maleylacetoacetate isomerase
VKLYTQWRNSAGERVRIALNLKGLDYEYVAVGSLPPGKYQQLNPQGLMPALDVAGRVIAQSTAILEFLEEVYPQGALLPEDPFDRAEVRAFAQLIASDLHPINNNRVRKYLSGHFEADAPGLLAWYHHWVRLAFDALEATLVKRRVDWPFCFGEAPGWADLHLVPQLANARRFGCDLSAYPRLVAVDGRCAEIDAFRRARPEAQPDYPEQAADTVPAASRHHVFSKLVPELLVTDLEASLRFWRDLVGFRVVYDRPEQGFAYLDHGTAQVMLEQNDLGHRYWVTGPLENPLGRGINFQIEVEAIAPILDKLAAAAWPLFMEPEEKWYRAGRAEVGQRQFLVQDPDGYLLRLAEDLGSRPVEPITADRPGAG